MTFVLANLSTPLLGPFLLLTLNLLIGWFEGTWTAKLCGSSRARAISLMVIANYVSAGVGLFTLGPVTRWLHQEVLTAPPLYSSGWILLILILGSLVATYFVELPFAIAAGRPVSNAWRTMKVFAGVQLASYVLTVGLFLAICCPTVYTRLTIVPVATLVPKSLQGWVYYFGDDRRSVWRVRLDGSMPERLTEVPADETTFGRQLYPLRSDDGESWDLWMTGIRTGAVLNSFAANPGVFYEARSVEPGMPKWWAADLRPVEDRHWEAATSRFAEPILRIVDSDGVDPKNPNGMTYAFAHPFEQWKARSLTVVPGGLVVAEFGEAQVLLIDVEGRKVGLLTKGYGPVVALDEPPAAATCP